MTSERFPPRAAGFGFASNPVSTTGYANQPRDLKGRRQIGQKADRWRLVAHARRLIDNGNRHLPPCPPVHAGGFDSPILIMVAQIRCLPV